MARCTVDADTTSFKLATLDGHLEAGQIQFRVESDYRSLRFEMSRGPAAETA